MTTAIAAAVLLSGCHQKTNQVKNVILMIADGASDGTWDIASYWENGALANNSYPYTEFTTRIAMTTFPLNTNTSPDDGCGEEVQEISYDKDQAWDETIVNDSDGIYTRPFAGYQYINENATDSAAAGTAMATGHKTYERSDRC